MWIKMTTPTFFFIDPTQTYDSETWVEEDHDGSTVAKAARMLPTTLQNNTCYLIRRGPRASAQVAKFCSMSGAITMTNGNRLAIVGMPKPDDELYAFMPAEAQTAWGADTNAKAVLIEPENFGNKNLASINCRDVLIYNCLIRERYYHRGSSGESENPNYWFNIIGEYVEIAKCENAPLNNDLTIGEFTNRYHNDNRDYWKVLCAFRTEVSISVLVRNCTLQTTFPCYHNHHPVIEVAGDLSGGAVVRDCNFYNTSVRGQGFRHDYSPGFVAFPGDNDRNKKFSVIVENINEYIISGNHVTNAPVQCLWRLFTGGYYQNLHVNNVVIQMNENQFDSTGYPNFGNIYHIEAGCFGMGSIIENVTCTIPACRGDVKLINMYEATLIWDRRTISKSQWYILRNIIAEFCPLDVAPSWSGGASNGSAVICFYSDLKQNWYNYQSRFGTCNQLIAQNINVRAGRWTEGYAVEIGDTMLDMISNVIEGRGNIRRCTGKLGGFLTHAASEVFNDGESNLLYIKKLQCNRNNPDMEYTGQPALNPSWTSTILVGETNTMFIADSYNNGVGDNNLDCMYVCTSNSIPGNFTVRNAKCKVETWSVNRTGGHSCTLRCLNEQNDASSSPILIGGKPFAGLKRKLAAGRHKLTFYVTTYGYNDPTQIKDKMRIWCKLPDGACVGGGSWEEDTTTVWNNIELNTSFKHIMYLELAEESDVEFTYQWWWYMKSAYTYIDPFPDDELLS